MVFPNQKELSQNEIVPFDLKFIFAFEQFIFKFVPKSDLYAILTYLEKIIGTNVIIFPGFTSVVTTLSSVYP